MNICRTIRRREAPITTRTATSVSRPAPWAKVRLATLAQATTRTKPTVTISTSNLPTLPPSVASRNGASHTVVRPLVPG